MELNVFKINFWKLYVSIEGAPDEELFLPKTSVVFHSYYIQMSQCSPITTDQPIVRSVIWYDQLR